MSSISMQYFVAKICHPIAQYAIHLGRLGRINQQAYKARNAYLQLAGRARVKALTSEMVVNPETSLSNASKHAVEGSTWQIWVCLR